MNNQEFFSSVADFVSAFELVFHADWYATQANIASDEDGDLIARNGTFLRPCVSDEENNWANRGNLLGAYRALRKALDERGFRSEFGLSKASDYR